MQGTIIFMSKSKTAPRAYAILSSIGLCLLFALGQPSGLAQSTGPAQQKQPSGASSATDSSAVANAQLNLYNASGQNGAQVTQDSYKGSIVTGKATDGVLDLSLDDAIQRGLRQNLGLILQSAAMKNANGQRLEELQALLPTINGTASIEVQQVNLAAYGLKFPGLNPIIGPFQVVDFRAYLTQNLVNVSALKNYIAAKHNFEGAKLTAEDARDLVVLTVGNAYLLCIADAARIEAVNAELATSKVSLDQAVAAHDAGTSPRLDVLRAQVDYQNEQQSLISTKNNLEKDKLALARTIGLPARSGLPPHRSCAVQGARQRRRSSRLHPGPEDPQGLSRLCRTSEVSQRHKDRRLGLPDARRKLRRRLRRHRHHPRPLPRHLLRHRTGQRARPSDREDPGTGRGRRRPIPAVQRQAVRPDPAGQSGRTRQPPRHPVRGQAC